MLYNPLRDIVLDLAIHSTVFQTGVAGETVSASRDDQLSLGLSKYCAMRDGSLVAVF